MQSGPRIIMELEKDKTRVEHIIDIKTVGLGILIWSLAIRWLDLALIEDAFDKIDNQLHPNKNKKTDIMTILILSILLSITFTVLGLIHFNWVVGGKWGFEKTLPTKENGERVLNPKKIDSAIVGLGLIFLGLFYLLKSGFLNFDIPTWVTTYGSWIIPSIFILRAIGDFKYVGFFKKIKETEFGEYFIETYF